MSGIPFWSALRLLAVDRETLAVRLQRTLGVEGCDVLFWTGLLSGISRDVELPRCDSELAMSDVHSLVAEWWCYADNFRIFLTRMVSARGTAEEPSQRTGIYKFDYKYGHMLMSRLSRMVLEACGMARSPSDEELNEVAAKVTRIREAAATPQE